MPSLLKTSLIARANVKASNRRLSGGAGAALRFDSKMTAFITADAYSIWHQTQDAYFDNRLLTTHTELLDDYSSLLSNYTRLQEDYKTSTDELGMARNLNYLLVITTVAFIATTAYFALRKPKLKGA